MSEAEGLDLTDVIVKTLCCQIERSRDAFLEQMAKNISRIK